MDKWVKNTQLWRLALPPVCLICGAAGSDGQDICRPCRQGLPWQAPACRCCAESLAGEGVCGHCQCSPPAFDQTYATFEYEEPVAHLVHELKFNAKLHVARLLGELMAQQLAASVVQLPDLLLPVPLHPQRLRQRGFNQSVELGRFVARWMGVPMRLEGCQRLRLTAPQLGKSAAERRQNLHSAFAASADVAGRRIALLDDVMTTGSTVGLLASTLKQAGAAHVQVWVCARASLRG